MRVILIGTSNAIYENGYAGGIRDDARVSKFDKFVVGASPSIIVPFLGCRIDFSSYDVAIFETAINDRNYYKYGSIRKDQIRSFIEWGVSAATEAGCKVALLVMPSKKAFNKETISWRIYKKISYENDLIFIDGFSYVRKVSERSGRSISDLFIDDFHIQKDEAYLLGRTAVDAICKKNVVTSRLKARRAYYRIDAKEISSEYITRSTSLMNCDLLQIKDEREFTICVEPGHEVIGIGFNAPKSNGNISLDGTEPKLVKSLLTPYTRWGKDLVLIVSPIVGECKVGESGKIKLRLARPEEQKSETSRFQNFLEVPNLKDSSVEVSSILICANEHKSP